MYGYGFICSERRCLPHSCSCSYEQGLQHRSIPSSQHYIYHKEDSFKHSFFGIPFLDSLRFVLWFKKTVRLTVRIIKGAVYLSANGAQCEKMSTNCLWSLTGWWRRNYSPGSVVIIQREDRSCVKTDAQRSVFLTNMRYKPVMSVIRRLLTMCLGTSGGPSVVTSLPSVLSDREAGRQGGRQAGEVQLCIMPLYSPAGTPQHL